jgi:hypothetical protein
MNQVVIITSGVVLLSLIVGFPFGFKISENNNREYMDKLKDKLEHEILLRATYEQKVKDMEVDYHTPGSVNELVAKLKFKGRVIAHLHHQIIDLRQQVAGDGDTNKIFENLIAKIRALQTQVSTLKKENNQTVKLSVCKKSKRRRK